MSNGGGDIFVEIIEWAFEQTKRDDLIRRRMLILIEREGREEVDRIVFEALSRELSRFEGSHLTPSVQNQIKEAAFATIAAVARKAAD